MVKPLRNSSVELFRILATFLVLIVHFNAWMLGGMPKEFDVAHSSLFSLGQVVIESLSIVCANCFLIISGYYGITFKYRTIWNIFVLLVMIYVPFYLLECICENTFSLKELASCFLALSRKNYFVQCYLMLCFLSPVLNAYIDKKKAGILNFVILFWGIEFYFDCLRDNVTLGFSNGYSLIHFILMYFLGRTVFIYRKTILSIHKGYYVVGYIMCVLIVSVLYIGGINWAYDYSNPIIIIESFCLFIPFLYYSYHRSWINWIASSTFAVYIMHMYGMQYKYLCYVDNYLLCSYPYPVYLLMGSIVILFTFIFCVMYDKLRIALTIKFTDGLYLFLEMKCLQLKTIFDK